MAEKAPGVELATGYISLTVSLRDQKQAISRQLEEPVREGVARAAKAARADLNRELGKVKPVDVIDRQAVGKGARAMKADLDAQLNGLRQQATKLRDDLAKQLDGSNVQVGKKIGDDVETGAGRARSALSGLGSAELEQLSTQALAPITAELGGIAGAAADVGTELAFVGGSIGPQAAVVGAIAAVALGVKLVNDELEEYRQKNIAAATSAEALNASLGRQDELIRSKVAVSLEEFRRANIGALRTLNNLSTTAAKQAYLVQIGYELRLKGASPEEAFEQIQRLADAAGIEVPVGIDFSSFQSQIDAARAQAQAIADDLARTVTQNRDTIGQTPGSDEVLNANQKMSLTRLAEQAAEAWGTGGPEAYAAVLAEVEQQLGANTDAINYYVDEAQKKINVDDLNTTSTRNVAEALRDLYDNGADLDVRQKRRLRLLLEEAEAQGDLTPKTIAAAAAQAVAGASADAYAEAQRQAAEESERLASASDDLSAALSRQRAQLQFVSVESQAMDAAAASYRRAIDDATRNDERFAKSLALGSALRDLREQISGVGDEEKKTTSETEILNKALTAMKDAVGRADPKLSAMGITLGALAAAAEGFRKSIADSTTLDDEIGAAVDLGDAWEKLRKVARRLPPTFDAQTASLGKYVPETREALRTLTQLGQATTTYLATLLETGRSHDEVRQEAARLREEYLAQFRAIGLTEEQAQSYIRTLGLTPEQIDTAIRVSGAEAARFKIQSYLQLLDGKIPAEVATSVAAKIDRGDLDGAAAQLASFAATNPVRIEVVPEVDPKKAEKIELPDVFDPAAWATGEFTDAQQRGLEAVQGLRGVYQDWLAEVAASQGPDAAVAESEKIRKGLEGILASLGVAQEDWAQWIDYIVGTPTEVTTAVKIAGLDEAFSRLDLYLQLLGDDIPDEVKTDVRLKIANGDLEGAQAEIDRFITDQNRRQWTVHFNLSGDYPQVPTRDPDRRIGSRAEGGPVRAGVPYLVGEKGPELVVPKAAAQVLPATVTAALVKGSDGATSGSTYNFGGMNFYGLDATEAPEEFARRLRIMERENRR